MGRVFRVARAITFAVLLAAPVVVQAEIARTIDFSNDPKAVTLRDGGVEVTLQPMFNNEGGVEVITSMSAPGFQTLIVREGEATSPVYARTVAIGKLSDRDPIPTVLLGGYSGGAHCCATLKALTPDAGSIKVVEFEPVDGGPLPSFPTDVDGDGVRDFVRQDDRFRYQFAPGAMSFSPPVFFNIYKGNIVDVSDQPNYRSIWEKFAADMRPLCAKLSDSDRNGACIAYVAAGARLGKFAEFLAEASKNASKANDIFLPKGCKVALEAYECPTGQEIRFYTFESAASWFLRANGYIN